MLKPEAVAGVSTSALDFPYACTPLPPLKTAHLISRIPLSEVAQMVSRKPMVPRW